MSSGGAVPVATVVTPGIAFTSTPNINIANKGSVAASGTGTNGDSISVTITDGTHTTSARTAKVSGGLWSVSGINAAALSDGAVTYSATGDRRGPGNTSTITQAATKLTVAPVVAFTSAPNVNIANEAGVSAAGSGTNGDTISVTITAGTHTTTAATTTVAAGVWSVSGINGAGLSDGTVTYAVTATDAVGNATTVKQTATKLTVAPVLAFTSTPNINIADKGNIAAAGTGTTGDTISVTITDGANTTTAATTKVAAGKWSVSGINAAGLGDGMVTYAVTETDAVGNPTTVTKTALKLTVAPVVQFTTTSNITNANVANASATGAGANGDAISVTISDGTHTTTAVATAVAVGAWSVSGINAASLKVGTITYAVTATDAAGNSTTIKQTATKFIAIVVTSKTTNVSANSTTLTIPGTGFDTNPANDSVVLSSGSATVTGATPATLTISVGGVTAGPLFATVSVDGGIATKTQIATILPVATMSTTSLAVNASSLYIQGFGFSTTAASDTVTFSGGVTGTISVANPTQLTITNLTGLAVGNLSAVVKVNGSSSASVQLATVAPAITVSSAKLAINATSLTITGFGFSTTPASNVVTFSGGATGKVTSSTATHLNITNLSGLTAGNLTVTVTTSGVSSGAPLQVGTVTPAGTPTASLLKNVGSLLGQPGPFVQAGSLVYFTVVPNNNGRPGSTELWSTNGTQAGTVEVPNVSGAHDLTAVGNTLYFAGAYNGAYGLFKYTGTTLTPITVGTTANSSPGYLTAVGNTLYFEATDAHEESQLWKYSGTGAATEIAVGTAADPQPEFLTALGSTLLFVAFDANEHFQLFEYSGAGAAATEITVGAAANDAAPSGLTVLGNTLYFDANDASNVGQLWKYSGNGPSATEIPLPVGTNPGGFTVAGSTLYFDSSYTNPLSGATVIELLQYSGSGSPTAVPDGGAINPYPMAAIGNTLFFIASSYTNSYQFLWQYGGSGTATQITVGTASILFPADLTPVGNSLYFTANDAAGNEQLWVYNHGNAASEITINPSGSSYPAYLSAVSASTMYLGATDGVNGYQPWIETTSVAGPAVAFTSTPNINIANKASVSVSGAGVNGDSISVTITDGTNTTTAASTTVSGGAWSVSGINASALQDGTVTFAVTESASGNTTTIQQTATKLTVAPVVAFTSTPNINVANKNSVSVSGTGNNGDAISVTITDGTHTTTAATTTVSGGAWSVSGINASGLNDGAVTYAVTETDAVGNATTVQQTAAKLAVAPVVTFTSAPNVSIANKNSVSASGTGTNGDAISVTITDGTTTTTAATTTVSGGAWSVSGINASGLNDGAVTYAVTETDAVGNSTTVQQTATKLAAAPFVAFTSTPNINIADENSVAASGTGNNGDSISVTITDGTNTTTAATTTVSGGVWSVSSINASGLNDGAVTYAVTQTDGNGGTLNNTQTATKLTVTPVVAFTSVPNITSSNVNNVSVSGTGVSGDAIAVTITDGTHTTAAAATTVSGGAWSVTGINPAGFNNGTVTYAVTETDAVGNATTVQQTANRSISIPVVTQSSANLLASSTTLTIAGSGFDANAGNDSVTLSSGSATITQASSISLTISVSGLTAGPLSMIVTADGGSSTQTEVATVIPVVTVSTASLASNATTFTINGYGFSTTAANNHVTFSDTATGTAANPMTTQLTITGLAGLTSGSLYATLSSNGISSGAPVQVATVAGSLAPIDVSGTISTNAIWSGLIVVTGSVDVASGVTLTIEPGTVIQFDSQKMLAVDGTLTAQGTNTLPIIFTSISDNIPLGGSNNAGNGSWGAIQFNSDSTGNVMAYTQVLYGGASTNGAVVDNDAPLSLTNSPVGNSSTAGLRIHSKRSNSRQRHLPEQFHRGRQHGFGLRSRHHRRQPEQQSNQRRETRQRLPARQRIVEQSGHRLLDVRHRHRPARRHAHGGGRPNCQSALWRPEPHRQRHAQRPGHGGEPDHFHFLPRRCRRRQHRQRR